MLHRPSSSTLMSQGAAERGSGHDCFNLLRNAAFVGLLAAVYMAISSGLITFNKYLMHESRFPYATFVGLLHMGCSFGFNALLFQLCPSLYPSMTAPGQKIEIGGGLFLRVLLPIAACFAGQLVLSNSAYLHSSVAFLQMMKQSNVVLVYVFSLALSLERFSGRRGLVLLSIAVATGLTVQGEMNFSVSGFAFQCASQLCEGLKLTLQSYSLSPTGRRLDALTYVLLVAPLVFLLLTTALVAMNLLWPGGCPTPYSLPPWSVVMEQRLALLGNGCLAFAMNVSHALFIKNSSAMTFILTGVVLKDVLIVVAASMFLGELLHPLQIIGFAMQLIGILVWSLLKAEAASKPASVAKEVEQDPTQWEALRSDAQDLRPEAETRLKSPAGSYGMPTVHSQSTMAPTDDRGSEESYGGA